MSMINKYSWLIFVLLLVSTVNGICVTNNNGDDVYYVNNQYPDVRVNITAGPRAVYVKDANIDYDGYLKTFDENLELYRFEGQEFIFNTDEDLENYDNVFFELNVFKNDNRDVRIYPDGDATKFKIEYDNVIPQLTNYNVNYIKSDKEIRFSFSEDIQFLELLVDGQKVKLNNIRQRKVDQSYNDVRVNIASLNLYKEYYEASISFVDLAGNIGFEEFEIYIIQEPLEVDLITLEDESDLKYFFDKDELAFFNKTIYSSEDEFSLIVQTNKAASCYFSSSLSKFKELSQVVSPIPVEMISGDGLRHARSVEATDRKIWVACQSDLTNEVVYLSRSLGIGDNLFDVKVHRDDKVNIKNYYPKELVSSNPFELFVETDQRALCYYSLDSSSFVELESTDYLNFIKTISSYQDGNHNMKLKCIDVLNREALESYPIKIDLSKGIKVNSFTPKYTTVNSANIEVELSDGDDNIECGFSYSKVSYDRFDEMTKLTGTGIKRIFSVSNMVNGDNTYYITCLKNDAYSSDEITLIYDKYGVRIEDVLFVNGEFKSKYLGSTDLIEVELDINSSIPIKRIVANVTKSDKTYVSDEFSDDDGFEFKGDFVGASSINIIAYNDNGASGNKIQKIIFDLNEPVLTVENKDSKISVECRDVLSGCAKVVYGFSQTNINCQTNRVYPLNESIDEGNNNYFCVRGYDYANNEKFEIISLSQGSNVSGGSSSSGSGSIEDDFPKNESEFPIDDPQEPENSNPEIKELDTPPVIEEPESSTGTILIVASIMLLLAGVSGGGYYAYKKGYLNNELEKLGIHLKKDNDNVSSSNVSDVSAGVFGKKSNTTKKTTSFTQKPIRNISKDDFKDESSTYDKHLRKLNNFIDGKINKTGDKFDKFGDSNHKGKVDKYHDTLAKKKSFHNDISKEDFDEFYTKSGSSTKKTKSLDNVLSSVNEAEDFEEYYKKKKAVKKTKTKSKKK